VQVLVVIRHGESEYNAAARHSPGWQDPKIFDPSLTLTGCQQAVRLRAQLAEECKRNPCLAGASNMLWVTSPLRRCIQTFLLSCPHLPEPQDSTASSPGRSVQQRIAAKVDALCKHQLPKIRIAR
jgi:broad specificity phosphatase PhoE